MQGNRSVTEDRSRRLLPAGLVAALAWLGAPRSAGACGGLFEPELSSAPVVAQRMVFSISEARTVLWSQFQFTGSPTEFSWVLPITPGAYLELSTDAWFEALEATTSVRVSAPTLRCQDQGCGGIGCGGGGDDDYEYASGAGGGGGVEVLHEESIGPYDTVTLRSDSGDALSGWLAENGFVVPPDAAPIIAAHVSEGQDFIALKLRPGAGVQRVQPVRVITPNGPPILPMRMVAAGAAPSIDIVLYVIGPQRFSMADFTEVLVEPSGLSYDFGTHTSNYLDLRQQALSFNGGQAFLTAYAARGFFQQGAPSFFVSTYLRSALGTASGRAYSDCAARVQQSAADDRLVVPDCASATGCTPPNAEQIAASQLSCTQFDDLAAALIGQHPARTWLTRLELRPPRTALTADCLMQPAGDQAAVSNLLEAQKYRNPPCYESVFLSSLSPARSRSIGPGLLAGLLAGAALRRVGRRRG